MTIPENKSLDHIKRLEELTSILQEELSETNSGVMALALELEHATEHYKSLFENAFDGIYQATFDGQYLSVNPSMARLLGFESAQKIIDNVRHIGTDIYNDAGRYQHLVLRIKKEKVVSGYISNIRSQDGSSLIINENLRILETPDGNPIGYEGVMSDLTASKQSEENLRLISTVFEYGKEGVIITDAEGIILRVNSAFTIIIGIKDKDVVGQKTKLFCFGNNADKQCIHVWDTVIENGFWQGEMEEVNRVSGEPVMTALTITEIRSKKGKIENYLCIFTDITEQYKARELLTRHEQELRQILDGVVSGIITMTEDGKILSFNQAAQTMFDYSIDEVLGLELNKLIPKTQLFQGKDSVRDFLVKNKEGLGGLGIELNGLRKNGSQFPLRLLTDELPPDTDDQRRFIASCTDITRQKQQEEQLRMSQKIEAMGKLTGGIAHDFNNILGIIIGYAEMLLPAVEENLEDYVQEVINAGERGAKLTAKLLSFTRHKTSAAMATALNTILREDKDLLEKTLTPRIKVNYILEDELWDVWLDKSDLEDAILNMSINALHAMKGAGSLTFMTSNLVFSLIEAKILSIKAGSYVQLSITDTGSGMDEATKSKIFDPFFTTKGDKGTGLGLSQVIGFVKRSNGAIKVYSELGIGTKMALLFPKYKTKNETKAININKEKTYQLNSLNGTETILVVDDEASLRKLAQKILNNHGYQVLTAENGNQALDIIDKEKVDLLLSDIIMPGIDGYQLAEQVRLKHPEMPIQLASGFSDDRAKNNKSDDLSKNKINKPYTSVTLLTRIRDLLNSKDK